MRFSSSSDDTGFRYHAGYPLEAAPDGKATLSDAVKIGQTPSGKAMRFEHLGSYADIDATYDAITAYLDEKGIDAQDSFVEEYANDVKDTDDPTLAGEYLRPAKMTHPEFWACNFELIGVKPFASQ